MDDATIDEQEYEDDESDDDDDDDEGDDYGKYWLIHWKDFKREILYCHLLPTKELKDKLPSVISPKDG